MPQQQQPPPQLLPPKKFAVRFLQFRIETKPSLSIAEELMILNAADARAVQLMIFVEGGFWVQRDVKIRSWVPHTAIIEVFEVPEQ